MLIKLLASLLQTTTQRYVTVWSICVWHGSVLMLIRWGGKWVHLTWTYPLCYLCAKNCQSWWKFDEVL